MTWRWLSVGLGAVVLVAAGAMASAQEPSAAAALFAAYRAGNHARVVQQVRDLSEPDADTLVRDLRRRVGTLVREAGRTDRARLDAATFLLDVAAARMEGDWLAVREIVEIACRLIDPIGLPHDGVLRWHLAALALIEGAADARFLVDTRRLTEVPSFDHLSHSRIKFPNEPRFRLAEVVIRSMGSADLAPPRDQPWVEDNDLRAKPGIGRVEVAMRNDRRAVLHDLLPLTTIAEVAPEAHLRAAHLSYQLNDDVQALAHLAKAEEADEPFTDYIAQLLTAMIHSRRGQRAQAETALRGALDIVPFAQSGVQLLSAELFLSGREADAHDLLERYFARPNPPIDPWRMFGYGDYRRLPALLATLRREVGK